MIYIPIRAVEDIETAVKILIGDAVEKAEADLEEEYQEKLDAKDEEIFELRQTILTLENEIRSLHKELMEND